MQLGPIDLMEKPPVLYSEMLSAKTRILCPSALSTKNAEVSKTNQTVS